MSPQNTATKSIIAANLTTVHWNINRYRAHKTELDAYLSTRHIDVLCLNEIRVDSNWIQHKDYNTYSKNRSIIMSYDGVAIHVHKHLHATVVVHHLTYWKPLL